ncbi:FkbM family methyltransferase [Methylobacterium pseudosasicola]|uniref:Methyltransferase, FkbM family n=1 Tax=Methylobacterium pseudosasicola TaxID=582667 RepID=A0A1I4TS03_9HYPH|nr:FkbM family methyltransferase [Methylobacterium pseudosasicola]SFM79524.1 methyltransferase, FkbM family [Methylobacterium pseudosasicola]
MNKVYEQYVHSLGMTYLLHGKPYDETVSSFPRFDQIWNLSAKQLVTRLAEGVKLRLNGISQSMGALITLEEVTSLDVGGFEILIPILNQQGCDWYKNVPISNYDFVAEQKLGLLRDARVIYDFGGHHGVWSAFYSKLPRLIEAVYTFEPSIINVEIAQLLMLINGITNVVINPTAISVKVSEEKLSSDGLLVDYIDTPLPLSDLKTAMWQKADFIKVDIEGFEYELITGAEWIFSACRNMHLELHIPHLKQRGLDYRSVFNKIPFDKFDVYWLQGSTFTEVGPGSQLEGFCTLLLKGKLGGGQVSAISNY